MLLCNPKILTLATFQSSNCLNFSIYGLLRNSITLNTLSPVLHLILIWNISEFQKSCVLPSLVSIVLLFCHSFHSVSIFSLCSHSLPYCPSFFYNSNSNICKQKSSPITPSFSPSFAAKQNCRLSHPYGWILLSSKSPNTPSNS